MINALSIDIEDEWSIFLRDWLYLDAEPSEAVVRNTEWFIETLDRFGVKATFFLLGEVAVKFPGLVKKIARNGHEIASHGISHKQIFRLSKTQFREEMADSKKLLEDIVSCPVLGYRAPAFSVMPNTKWALDVLAQVGFKYDSSVFPIDGRRYGWPGFSKDICKIDLPTGQSIIEVPMSTVTILGKEVAVAGGGYLRHFPYVFTRWSIKRIQKARPVIVYMHPYEIDNNPASFQTRHLSFADKVKVITSHKIQLRNRNTVAKKLIKLLSEFKFAPISTVIEKLL
ncbi:MAG: DUF3473 domain-containing protein [Planctomycetota bacterium]|jgi:polysaccharide deacetylase family protein (PEP-CTERM system associated)